jgi:Ca2+/Na+ antiporter
VNRKRTVLFVVIALFVMVWAVYIVIVVRDLTAILLGLFLVVLIYVIIRYASPETTSPLPKEEAQDQPLPPAFSPPIPSQTGTSTLPITINVNQGAPVPPPPLIVRRCSHCNSVYSESLQKCPSCGAPF